MSSSQLSQEVYDITLTSTIPYLQNRFRIEEHSLKTTIQKGQKVYVPEDEAEKALYRDPDSGNVYLPSDQILMATVKAGAAFKIKGNKTFKSVLPSIMVVEPDRIPLLDEDGVVLDTWQEIDSRAVVVQRARVVRHRPKFNSWTAKFKVHILDTSDLTAHGLKEIMENAGRFCGLGDYRPRFGRFYISSFKVGGQEELVEQELTAKTA